MRANPEALMIRKLLAATAAIAATTVLTPAQSRPPARDRGLLSRPDHHQPADFRGREVGQVLRDDTSRDGQQHEDGAFTVPTDGSGADKDR